MKRLVRGRYSEEVHYPGRRISRTIAAWAVYLLGFFIAPSIAGATVLEFPVGDQAFVHVNGRQAIITVKTWDRNAVQVDWPDGEPFTAFKGSQNWIGAPVPIPGRPVKEKISPGNFVDAALPSEEFPITGVAIGLHDSIRIKEDAPPPDLVRSTTDFSHVTVTIPTSAKIVELQDGRGDVFLSDYRGNTFVSGGGARVVLTNVSGDAFVQSMFGHLYALDSNFDHLRARSNGADLVFERCHIKQIEASTLTGSIVYDNGSFEPGLARFESDRGNVALGVSGNAQLGAHVQDGHIFSTFSGRSAVTGANDGSAVVGNGGPLVNATSAHGNVYMYEGSIVDRRGLASDWRNVTATLVSKRRQHQGLGTAATQPKMLPQQREPQVKLDRKPHGFRRIQTKARTFEASLRRV